MAIRKEREVLPPRRKDAKFGMLFFLPLRLGAFAGEFPAFDFSYAAIGTAPYFALGKLFRLW